MNGRAVGGALTALLAGLVAAASGATTWLSRDVVRLVGGVQITETQVSAGTQFAPLLLPVGLLVVVLAAAALLLKVARRTFALLLAAGGLAVVLAGSVGIVRVVGLDGRISAAPWLAVLAGLVTSVGAWSLARSAAIAAPLLNQRYTVEGASAEDPDAQEWHLAEGDSPES